MTWFPPKLKIAPPKDALTQGLFMPVPEGMMAWKNRRNGYVVLVMGYLADPAARTKEWWDRATEGMRPHEIDTEYLCSFHSRGGQKVFPWLEENPEKFVRSHKNYREGSTWKVPQHWHLLGGLDYGGNQNPTAFYIFAIDEKKQWHVIYEYYKPSHYREIADAILHHPLYGRLIKIIVDPSVYKRDQHLENRVGAFTSVGELLGDAGVHILEHANNERIAGLARVLDTFNQRPGEDRPTKIFISDDCPEIFRELSRIIYKQETQVQLASRNPADDVQKKDDHCFTADTLIHTETGYRAISEIKVGELVMTRVGFKPVIRSWQTGIKDTLRLYFSNGSDITCTANHPIYTANRGFIRADELRESDICVADQAWKKKKWFLTALLFGDIRTRLMRACENILSAQKRMVSKDIFTARSGSFIAEKSQRAIMSITEMATRSIMTFQTLSACPESNTISSMPKTIAHVDLSRSDAGFSTKLESLRKFGTLLPKEEHGTQGTEKRHGRKESQLHSLASNAERNTSLFLPREATQGSAPITASLPHAELPALTISKFLVSNAVRNLKRIAIAKHKRVGEPVAQLLRIESGPRAVPVYNLTVEDQHEYYAKGLLVSNSYDAMRYAIMGWDAEAEWNAPRSLDEFAIDRLESEIDERYDQEELLDSLFN